MAFEIFPSAASLPPSIRAFDVELPGARIHAVEAGVGDPPFLLVHGWGSSVLKWHAALPHLAAYRRTIALDLPGCGRSSTPDGPYSPAWLAGAVRAFMDEIGVARAVVVGNSLGGLVAVHVAAAWPDRVTALVGVAPALPNDGPQPPLTQVLSFFAPTVPVLGEMMFARYCRRPPGVLVAESLARNCVDPTRVSPELVALFEEECSARATDYEQQRAMVRANRKMMWALSAGREQTWRVLRAVKAPTMFLWGEHDKLLPVHIARKAVRELPGSQLVVLEDAGHNPQIEHPERFAGAVVAFARAAEARRATGEGAEA